MNHARDHDDAKGEDGEHSRMQQFVTVLPCRQQQQQQLVLHIAFIQAVENVIVYL